MYVGFFNFDFGGPLPEVCRMRRFWGGEAGIFAV